MSRKENSRQKGGQDISIITGESWLRIGLDRGFDEFATAGLITRENSGLRRKWYVLKVISSRRARVRGEGQASRFWILSQLYLYQWKNFLPAQETQEDIVAGSSLGRFWRRKQNHSSIFVWENPWQRCLEHYSPKGLQRVRRGLGDHAHA